MIDISTRICGIPCKARVTHFHHQPPHRGSPHTCDSDLDFYGYKDLSFDILDRRGRPAPWLERKMTDADREEIESEILAVMNDE